MEAIPTNVTFYKKIVYFNRSDVTVLFENTEPVPEGVTPVFMLVDGSGSIKSHEAEMRRIAASFLDKSNAALKISVIPQPSDRTNIIETFQQFHGDMMGCDVILITDGLENCFEGKLAISCPNGGEVVMVDFGSLAKEGDEYLTNTANYLSSVCGAQLYYLGLGVDSKRMAEVMIKRRNTHVAFVPNRATDLQIIGIVRALRHRGSTQAALPIEQRTQQEGPIVTISEEVKAIIEALDENEINAVVRASNVMTITGVFSAPPPPMTAEDIKAKFEVVEASITGDFPSVAIKEARLVMLLAMQSMADNPVPLALFTGGRCGVIDFTNKTVGKYINTAFSRLVAEKIVTKEGITPDAGAKVVFESKTVQIPKKSAMYKLAVPIEAIKILAEDGDFADPADELKRKGGTKRKAEEAGEESGSSSGSPNRAKV